MAGARAANGDVICSTSVIPTLSVRDILLFPRCLASYSMEVADQVPAMTALREFKEASPDYSKNLVDENGHVRRLTIPLFQRRYCWRKSQLSKFLSDALKQVSFHFDNDNQNSSIEFLHPLDHGGHRIGRIVTGRSPPVSPDGSLASKFGAYVTVLDGQQRFTTCVLLLAALGRFVRANLTHHQSITPDAPHEPSQQFLKSLDRVLYPGWRPDIDVSTTPPEDAAGVAGACLLPTFLDRAEFWHHTSPLGANHTCVCPVDDNSPLCFAARYYEECFVGGVLTQLSSKSGWGANAGCKVEVASPPEVVVRAATAVSRAVLDRMFVLLFEPREKDTTTVYERLAFRGDKFGVNRAPGVDLSETDLVRNLLLSYMPTEKSQTTAFARWWCPLEVLLGAHELPPEEKPKLLYANYNTMPTNFQIPGLPPNTLPPGVKHPGMPPPGGGPSSGLGGLGSLGSLGGPGSTTPPSAAHHDDPSAPNDEATPFFRALAEEMKTWEGANVGASREVSWGGAVHLEWGGKFHVYASMRERIEDFLLGAGIGLADPPSAASEQAVGVLMERMLAFCRQPGWKEKGIALEEAEKAAAKEKARRGGGMMLPPV